MNPLQVRKLYIADQQRLPTGEALEKRPGPLPPFRFPGVTSRVFPLRADIGKLKRICDGYFNKLDVPQHIAARFDPAAPLVYLAILHYDQMFEESREGSKPKRVLPGQSRIWVSQHELAFMVPLEWRRKEGKEMVFKNWAFTIPFLFVSNPLSLTLGREVYGWPKLRVKADPDIDQWVFHPRDPSHLVTLSIAQPEAQQEEKFSKLLKIQMKPSPAVSQLRPDPNPFAMLFDAPRTVMDGLGTMVDLIDIFAGMPVWNPLRLFRQKERAMQQTQARMTVKGLKNLGSVWSDLLRDQVLSAVLPDFSYNTIQDALLSHLSDDERLRVGRRKSGDRLSLDLISLKQFRLAGTPERACYQELVRSEIDILNIVNGGLLGDINYLQSDPTGGFEIHMYREPMGERIIESLGLEVSEKRQEPEEQQKDGNLKTVPVAVLKPFYPFWTETNLRYGVGHTLCWRVGQTWHEKEREGQGEAVPRSTFRSDVLEKGEDPPKYVTMKGVVEPGEPPAPSRQVSASPGNQGKKPKVTIRVYPLPTKGIDVAKFLEDLGIKIKELFPESSEPAKQFGVVGRYVYLIIMNTQHKDNLTGKGTPWEVAFSFPVKWTTEQGPTLALFSPFVFREATNGVIIDREVTGRPSVDAALEANDAWLREDRLRQASSLKLKTEIIPSPDEKAQEGEVTERLLLEISQSFSEEGEKKPKEPNLHKDNALRIKSVMVKQFPDAENPQENCYQAIVVSQRTIEKIQVSEISEKATISISVHENTGRLIVERLGLDYPVIKDQDGREQARLSPVRPFTIWVEMEDKATLDVLARVHNESWNPTRSYEEALESRDPQKDLKFDNEFDPFNVIKSILDEG